MEKISKNHIQGNFIKASILLFFHISWSIYICPLVHIYRFVLLLQHERGYAFCSFNSFSTLCIHLSMYSSNAKYLISRYVEVMMRLATFDTMNNHPGHFNKVIHSHTTVRGLMQIIREETSLCSNKLAVFTDKSRDAAAMLPVHKTLEECGFEGGSKRNPTELLLYYDYVVEHKDCPLLLCDHYFGNKIDLKV